MRILEVWSYISNVRSVAQQSVIFVREILPENPDTQVPTALRAFFHVPRFIIFNDAFDTDTRNLAGRTRVYRLNLRCNRTKTTPAMYIPSISGDCTVFWPQDTPGTRNTLRKCRCPCDRRCDKYIHTHTLSLSLSLSLSCVVFAFCLCSLPWDILPLLAAKVEDRPLSVRISSTFEIN